MSRIKKLVLVVEDEPTLKEALRKHLTSCGFDVIVAFDGSSAMRIVSEQLPDLVCLDLVLPRESGYEVCEHIRRNLKILDLPILLMSDRRSPEDRAHAEEAGASALLTKPFTMEQLSGYVESLLSGSLSRRI